MTAAADPLSASSAVGDWLEHPRGGPLLRELLAQGGQDERSLAPVRLLPLQRLVELSQGRMPQSVVDDLVARANDPSAPLPEPPPRPGWQERIVPGRFTECTVVVTGAASGIGRATASRIGREGGRVIAIDVNRAGLEQLQAELETCEIVPVEADVTSQADVDNVVATAGARIDALANVAGIMDDFAPLHEVSDAMWQRLFAVNVEGLFRLTRAVLPAMLAAGRGSVVNVTSEAGLRGGAAGTAYTATKHAVIGITRSAAYMYAPHGIRVNAVAPGGVATGMRVSSPNAFGQSRLAPQLALIPPIAMPEHLAASIAFLLSDDAVNITGAVLPSDGGWSVQ